MGIARIQMCWTQGGFAKSGACSAGPLRAMRDHGRVTYRFGIAVNPVGGGVRPVSVSRPSDAFVDDVRGRLVGALVLDLGDRWVAEEVAQEALTKAVLHWGRVSRMASPEGWVFRVAFNTARSRFRRRAAERRAYAKVGRPDDVMAGPEQDVPEAVMLRQAVEALPARQRQVVAARFYADLSVADTAVVMGCAEGTVKSLTSKAVASLRANGVVEVIADG